MGRPRKPTAMLNLVDAHKKDPQRARPNEPVCTDPVILPPLEITAGEKMAWNFLVDGAVAGVLTRMDSAYLFLCAKGLAEVWVGDVNVGDICRVSGMIGKLGMSPSERSKVVVPNKDNEKRTFKPM